MYVIKDRRGIGKEKSSTIFIKKQNTKEQTFTITWANTSTIEAKNIIEEAERLFEDRMRLSDVFEMLNSIVAVTDDTVVHRFVRDLSKRLRGECQYDVRRVQDMG